MPGYNLNQEAIKLQENKKLLNEINDKLENKSFKNVIRNFSQKISKLRDQFLQKNDLNIDKWLLEDISNEQFDSLEQDIINIL